MRSNQVSFSKFAWFVLAWNIPVVLWGALVRVTGSGAGCGNHWPDCNGQFTPSANVATIIEFTHRAMTGVDGLLVVALLIWAFRAFPRHHPARLGATLSTIFLVTEALLGAMLVKLEHVATNASIGRGYSLSTHLVNTLGLLACLALTAWWGSGRPAIRARGKAAALAIASLVVVLMLGVSGAVAALGDTLYPAQSLAAGLAQDLDPSASIFVRLRLFHPAIAIATAAWLLFFGLTSIQHRPDARPMAWIMMGFLAIQVLAGATNLLLLAPGWMQMIHLLLADLLWISLVLLCARILAEKTLEEKQSPKAL